MSLQEILKKIQVLLKLESELTIVCRNDDEKIELSSIQDLDTGMLNLTVSLIYELGGFKDTVARFMISDLPPSSECAWVSEMDVTPPYRDQGIESHLVDLLILVSKIFEFNYIFIDANPLAKPQVGALVDSKFTRLNNSKLNTVALYLNIDTL